MEAIRTEGLEKRFGSVRALDGLTLRVEPHTIYGFLGPNGAGKTTTIRLLAGLARPSGGRAWVAGLEVGRDRRALARCIGYLPEEPAFYPWMTPEEYLDLVGRIFGLPAGERRVRTRQLLRRVGLEEVRRRQIGGFSRGMRQRLGLAQALMNRPQVLFLDEPLSALDPTGRKDVLNLIESLRSECTVFMSTHILADVERVCDTVGIIAKGRMVAEAPQEELARRYAVPAFELECEQGEEETLAAWAAALPLSIPWVEQTMRNGNTVRVIVRDTTAAKRELPALAVRSGLTLNRYEMVRPSLEDIFLRLVGPGGPST
ncbi:MAG: ATP-binding cassette domain-containing protein [Chloroflexia bacterium]